VSSWITIVVSGWFTTLTGGKGDYEVCFINTITQLQNNTTNPNADTIISHVLSSAVSFQPFTTAWKSLHLYNKFIFTINIYLYKIVIYKIKEYLLHYNETACVLLKTKYNSTDRSLQGISHYSPKYQLYYSHSNMLLYLLFLCCMYTIYTLQNRCDVRFMKIKRNFKVSLCSYAFSIETLRVQFIMLSLSSVSIYFYCILARQLKTKLQPRTELTLTDSGTPG
jgi:hypothetical protein